MCQLPLNNASEPTVQYSRLLGELCYKFAGLDSAMVGTVCNVGTGKAHPSELSGTLILPSHGHATVAAAEHRSLSTSISVKRCWLFWKWEVLPKG